MTAAGKTPKLRPRPGVEIVVPVYNEAHVLSAKVRELHAFCGLHVPQTVQITVVDNASTDGTINVARLLAATLPGVDALRLERKGRGHALKTAWLASDAKVRCYMDVDLSTDLTALPELISMVWDGRADIAIGNRLDRASTITRSFRREMISRAYNRILRLALGVSFTDAQCGFKAISGAAAQRLLPLVEDQNWFFDTELLVIAQHNGLTVGELPVRWVEDPDSRVNIIPTALEDLRGVRRLRAHVPGEATTLEPPAIHVHGSHRRPRPRDTHGRMREPAL